MSRLRERNLLQVVSELHAWSMVILYQIGRSSRHVFFNVNMFNPRGERCKFKHPADKKEGDEKIPFCNDFRQVVRGIAAQVTLIINVNTGHMQIQGMHLCPCSKGPRTGISANW